MADHAHAVQVHLLQHVHEEIGDIGNVIDEGRRLGEAEARQVGHDHVIALCEIVENFGPFGQAVSAMQEQQGLPRAATLERNLRPVHRDRLCDEVHWPFPRFAACGPCAGSLTVGPCAPTLK